MRLTTRIGDVNSADTNSAALNGVSVQSTLSQLSQSGLSQDARSQWSGGSNDVFGGPIQQVQPAAPLDGDARLAVVFRQIRAIHGLSEIEMARRLGTGIDVILSCEAGSVDSLPPWPETARIVERYADLGGVDPAPILSRVLSLQTLPVAPPPAAPPPARSPEVINIVVPQQEPRRAISYQARPAIDVEPIGFAARPRLKSEPTTGRPKTVLVDADPAAKAVTSARRRRRLRKSLLVATPVLLFAVLFVAAYLMPRSVYALARSLPSPLAGATRGVIDVVATQTAAFKDGLRWIEVDDPRMRKAHREK